MIICRIRVSSQSLISNVLSPPIISLFSFLLLLSFPFAQGFALLFAVAALFGTVIPVLALYLLHKKGVISDFYVTDRKSRSAPFLIIILSYVAGAVLLLAFGAPAIVTTLMLCYIVNAIVTALITLAWKISIHSVGITGPMTLLMYAFGPAALPIALLAIPIGWARIKLKAHTPAQVLAGLALGVVLTLIQIPLYLLILSPVYIVH